MNGGSLLGVERKKIHGMTSAIARSPYLKFESLVDDR